MNAILRKARSTVAILVGLLLLALVLMAQQSTEFVIKGKDGSAKVAQVEGSNYVEIDGLARLTNGTISFQDNQIVLTLSSAGASTKPSATPTGFSKQFLTAGIETMARIREWHSALKTAIERGVPLTTGWLNNYQAQSQESLTLASAAISTDSDNSAYPLLVNVFSNMKVLTDKYVQQNQSQDYISPDSLQSDPLEQQIVACGHSLAAMAAAKEFISGGSCQ
jgi:hypothetical protein